MLPQHAQMLRDPRLGNPELRLDDGGDRTGGLLTLGEQLQDPAPHRVAENVERVHSDEDDTHDLYKSNLILVSARSGTAVFEHQRPRQPEIMDAAPANASQRKLLAIYLNDHLAGATGGVELAGRAARANRGRTPDISARVRALTEEVRADRRSLREIMAALGVTTAHHKVFAAWLGEKAGRFKLNAGVLRRSPLSALIEVEALHLAVQGKARGWRTLLAAAEREPGLDAQHLRTLLDRAQQQLIELEDLHHEVATQVFGTRGHRPA